MTLEAAAANANYGTSASGSSFYAAMRILPRDQRAAMFQIYSFCRQVDDIADSNGPRPERLARSWSRWKPVSTLTFPEHLVAMPWLT